MASSGSAYSNTVNSSSGLYGAKFRVDWTATPTDEPGVTKVSWRAYAVGREGASSNTRGYARLYLYAHNSTDNSSTIVEGNGKQIGSYSSGDYNYISYQGTFIMEGSFHVKHEATGKGGFRLRFDPNIGGLDPAENTVAFTLDENVPYYYVYIDTGSSTVKAVPYIDDGTDWKAARVYVDDGTEWKACS